MRRSNGQNGKEKCLLVACLLLVRWILGERGACVCVYLSISAGGLEPPLAFSVMNAVILTYKDASNIRPRSNPPPPAS